ncbi:MAG: pilus assembly protein [Caulobacteraceae bacterium]|nr:pilus assembly protein [Caulobacter sp.]RYF92018.1 MAG: pilus assembly protein [Caulobacteraceae bacterium]
MDKTNSLQRGPFKRARRFLARFGSAQRGAAAVEFAFVAAPFLGMLFAVLELGMVFLVSTTLQNAADSASRKIRTGELQASGGTRATFKDAICADMSWLGSDCATNLKVDVQTYTNFDALMEADPNNPGSKRLRPPTVTGGVVQEGAWQPGGAEAIVLVRAYYSWTLITPLLNAGLPNLGNSKRLISTTVAFRNEPWGT